MEPISGAVAAPLLACIVERAPIGLALIDASCSLTVTNPALASLLGIPGEGLARGSFLELLRPEDREATESALRRIIEGEGGGSAFEARLVGTNGAPVWVRISQLPVRCEGETYAVLVAGESTKGGGIRSELEVQSAHFEGLFESSPEGLVLLDQNDSIIRINPEFTRIFGYTPEEAAGRRLTDLIVPEDRASEALGLTMKVAGGERVGVRTVRRRKDGSLVNVSVMGAPIEFRGSRLAVYGIYRDISEQVWLERTLEQLTVRDELTGLLNRRGFFQIASREMKLAKRRRSDLLLFYMDLNEFKEINDLYGHVEGDRALRDVADIIGNVFRETDLLARIADEQELVARLGGDEFVILAIDAKPGSEDLLSQRVIDALEVFNDTNGRPYRLTMSIGSARATQEHPRTLDQLIVEADEAMYRAKRGETPERAS